MSDEDLIQRALTDNWELDYFHHYVEVYNGTQKLVYLNLILKLEC